MAVVAAVLDKSRGLSVVAVALLSTAQSWSLESLSLLLKEEVGASPLLAEIFFEPM